MKRYISMFVLLIIVLLLVMSLGLCLNSIIQKNKEIVSLNQKIEDMDKTIANLNSTIENMNKNESENENEQIEEPVNEEKNYIFDQSKITNKPENSKVYERIYDRNDIINISVDNSSNSLIVSLNAEAAKQFLEYNGLSDTHTVTGFSSKIVDAKIVSTGNRVDEMKIVMLMEDGTVKFIDIDSVLSKTYTVSNVSNANNIIKLVEVVIETESKTSLDVVGIKDDGTSMILEWEQKE